MLLDNTKNGFILKSNFELKKHTFSSRLYQVGHLQILAKIY